MITAMNHVTLAVTNIEKSFAFYKDVLGLSPLVKWNKGAYFLVGQEFWFCLNVDPNRVINPCYTHYAFSVSLDDFHVMSQKIMNAGAVMFKENTSPGESLYFLDPDGHKLEIHTGNWQDRMQIKRANQGNWQDVQWYA